MAEAVTYIPFTNTDEGSRSSVRPARRGLRTSGLLLSAAAALAVAGCGAGRGGMNTSSAGASAAATTSGAESTRKSTTTCEEDPAKATSKDVDPKNPTIIFSWLCGGPDTVFVYPGPYDTTEDKKEVGQYYGTFDHPGKNVVGAKCYITNGRQIPRTPQADELQLPPSTHWIETDADTWAPEYYTFNGPLLEKVLHQCDVTPPSAAPAS